MHHTHSLLGMLSKASLGLLAPVLAACGNDDGGGSFSDFAGDGSGVFGNANTEPVPGCEGEFFGACQYSESSCQKKVFATVRCMLDVFDAEMPPVVEITTSEFADELAAEIAADDSNSAGTAAYNRAMVLIGMAAEGSLDTEESIDAYVDTVPAFYSPDTDTVTIVVSDDGTNANDAITNTTTLAHEFTHAVQNQEHDLVSIQSELETTYDGYLATRSGIEGEATLFELFYYAANSGIAIADVDFRAAFMEMNANGEDMLQGMTPLLAAPRVFPYTYGGRYVYNVYDAGGTDALKDLPSYIPATTLEVMESEYSRVTLDLPAPFETVPSPASGYTFMGYDVMGAWLLHELVEIQELDGVDATDIQGWARDQVAVYGTEAGQVAVVWRLEFTGNAAATAFSEAFSGASFYPEETEHQISVAGNTVTLLVLDDPGSLDAWDAALASSDTLSLKRASLEEEGKPTVEPPRLIDVLRRKSLGVLAPHGEPVRAR